VKSNDNREFGKPSRFKVIEAHEDMNKLMNQEYMREYLQNKLTRNSVEY